MSALRKRHAANKVLAMGEARRCLPQTSRYFEECGAKAEPVFFGAHRKPAGVMLSYELYLHLLDRVDDLSIALQIRERDQADTGERVSVNELLGELGFDRATLEAEIAAEDESDDAPEE